MEVESFKFREHLGRGGGALTFGLKVALLYSLLPNRTNIKTVKTRLVRFVIYNKNGQVEEDEMGGVCSTNGIEEEQIYVTDRKAREK
jgi:hypothetical protein